MFPFVFSLNHIDLCLCFFIRKIRHIMLFGFRMVCCLKKDYTFFLLWNDCFSEKEKNSQNKEVASVLKKKQVVLDLLFTFFEFDALVLIWELKWNSLFFFGQDALYGFKFWQLMILIVKLHTGLTLFLLQETKISVKHQILMIVLLVKRGFMWRFLTDSNYLD